MPRRPFGRSLDPLPEEDIGGYLLRLSAHLCMAPSTLLRTTGLSERGGPQVVRQLLLHAELGEFAKLARLTLAEARALTVIGWKERYEPINTALVLRSPGRESRAGMYNWMYAGTARHCPTCLAGDSSAIQNAYGGAWRRIWRLPIAFACIEHELFLAEGCGSEHARRLGMLLLIPGASISDMHPAQCRLPRPGEHGRGSTPCGARLDDAGTATIRPGQRHLDIQRKILDHLGPDTTPAQARRFFTDLRLIAALLNRVPFERWSAIDPAVHQAIAGTIAAYVAKPAGLDTPPLDVVSTATLLSAATTILEQPERQAELLNLAYSSTRGPGLRSLEKVWARHAPHATPDVQKNLVAAITTRWARYGPKYEHGLRAILDVVAPQR